MEKEQKKKKTKIITGKANKKGQHIMKFMNFLRCCILPFYCLIKPFKFYGPRKVKDGACVYVINHYTILDPAYPIATTWEGIHFLGKKEILKTPVFSFVARTVKMIPVNRDGNDVRALLDAYKCLKNGEKIAIFPEGTRNKTNEPFLPFKAGAAMLAIRAKAPIVPMVIYKKPRCFRKTHILTTEPFKLSQYYDRKLTDEELAEADELVSKYMQEMYDKHTEFLQSKKKKGK